MTNPPPSWTPSKVKYLGRYINGYAFKPGDWSDSDIGKPIIRIQNLTDSEAPLNYYEGTLHDDLLVKTGDLLISWSASLGAYEWRKEDAWLNQHIFKVDLNSKIIEKRYFKWLAIHFMGDLSDHAHGSTMQHLTKDRFGKFPVTLPPIPEQLDIADYLDRETARIDELVAAKESMLQLLEEKRAALISRAVTRGLDPQAPTKPSGLDWLGEIPRHWEVRRGKFIFNQSSLPVQEDDEIVTCFRDGEVTLRRNRREEGFTNAILELGYQGIRSGQLVLHSMDAFAGAIGVSDSNGKCSPEYIICDPIENNVNSFYFGSTLRLMALRGYIQAACTAVRERAPRIRFSHLANMFLPLPPRDEQDGIVQFIINLRDSTSGLEQELKQSITLLKGRRSALITAAVTGQIPNPSAE